MFSQGLCAGCVLRSGVGADCEHLLVSTLTCPFWTNLMQDSAAIRPGTTGRILQNEAARILAQLVVTSVVDPLTS